MALNKNRDLSIAPITFKCLCWKRNVLSLEPQNKLNAPCAKSNHMVNKKQRKCKKVGRKQNRGENDNFKPYTPRPTRLSANQQWLLVKAQQCNLFLELKIKLVHLTLRTGKRTNFHVLFRNIIVQCTNPKGHKQLKSPCPNFMWWGICLVTWKYGSWPCFAHLE